MSPRDPQTARIVAFPDLKPATRSQILSGEIGTQFDAQQHMFSLYSGGDVFLPGSIMGPILREILRSCSAATGRPPPLRPC
jgi:hypothetical protein